MILRKKQLRRTTAVVIYKIFITFKDVSYKYRWKKKNLNVCRLPFIKKLLKIMRSKRFAFSQTTINMYYFNFELFQWFVLLFYHFQITSLNVTYVMNNFSKQFHSLSMYWIIIIFEYVFHEYWGKKLKFHKASKNFIAIEDLSR